MTIDKIFEGIGAAVVAVFPGVKIHTDKIPQLSSGRYYVGLINQTTTHELGTRRRERYSFEVLYFKQSEENISYATWAQAMHRGMNSIRIGDYAVSVDAKESRKTDDMVYTFTFSIDLLLIEAQTGDKMANMEQEVRYGETEG